jgi:hypothetical protein
MARRAAELHGMNEVMQNLNKQINEIKAKSMASLIKCSILVRRDMDLTPPLIPVDIGNLRLSWFTSPIRQNFRQGIIMGFSANYATKVHEMVDGDRKINWTRPNSGAKFFQAALYRNVNKMLEIIRTGIILEQGKGMKTTRKKAYAAYNKKYGRR